MLLAFIFTISFLPLCTFIAVEHVFFVAENFFLIKILNRNIFLVQKFNLLVTRFTCIIMLLDVSVSSLTGSSDENVRMVRCSQRESGHSLEGL